MGVMDRYNEKKKKKETSSEENSSSGVMQRYEQRKYYDSLDTDGVDEKYISSFISDTKDFLSNAEKSYSGLGYSNASSSYDTLSSTWKDLHSRGDTIRGWLYKNGNTIGKETYDSVSKSLDSFYGDAQSIIKSFEDALNEFSRFETEDAYNEYVNRYKNYGDLANTAEAPKGWEKYLTDQEAKAQAAKEEQDNEKWYETLGRYLSNNGAGIVDTNLPMANTTQYINDLRNDVSYMRPKDDWTEDQKNVFGALYLSNPAEAYHYAEYANKLNAKTAEAEQMKKIYESATSSFGSGLGQTLAAIALAPMGMADYLDDLSHIAAGREITDDGFISPFEYSQAVTSGITSQLNYDYGTLDERIPIIGGKGLGDAYGWASSTAQSIASAYALGPTGMLFSYFGQGAASSFDEKLSQGWSEESAMVYGTTVGIIEGVWEAIGGERLLSLGPAAGKNFVRQFAGQAAAEGLEGGLSSLGAKVAEDVIDRVYQDGFTTYELLVQEYMANGMSKSEAEKKAWWTMAEEVAFDTLSEGLSGGVGGGVQTGIQNISANKQASNLYGDNASDLVNESLEINPNNKFAQKMQNRIEGGKNLSGGQINRLIDANEAAMRTQDVSAIQNATVERLTALGETGDVNAIAKALTKQAQGEKLTVAERHLIQNSKYGQRVANELNTDNIKSGQYSSAWAEEIGTNRINAEEYSRALADAENVTDTNVGDKIPEVIQTAELPPPVEQASAQAEETAPVTENVPEIEIATESDFEASEGTVESEEESTVTLADASKKYGAQAQAMIHTYTEGQNVEKYDNAYSIAYNMGMSGVSLDYAKNSDATAYLSETQRELAYEAGKAAADTSAKEQDAKNKALVNGKTGRRKGVVKGEGVTIADLKASFNDTQNMAYKVLSTYAEATGVDIVLYKSEADAEGNYIGAQGKFKWSDDNIYIDVNAGLSKIKDVNDLAKYAMLRTFSHEFTHFVEKWNPIWYNEFRKVVFDTLTQRGEDVHDLIETKMSMNEGMSYDKASREVVAEAMTDILPDANFVETLATKNKNIFDKLLEKLKEFLADLKAYFKTIGHNPSREANALKEQVGEAVHYVDNIVKLFDKVALEAVENYQATVATEEATVSEVENVDPYEAWATIDMTPSEDIEARDRSADHEVDETIDLTIDETVDETVTETTNEVDEKGEGDAFTITDNAEYGTLEIKFDGKPSEAVRNVLKAHKFRWHKVKGIWYGKSERADIVKALREAYQAEDKAEELETKPEEPEAKPVEEKTATEVLREMGGKAVSDNMTDVTDLFFPALATTNNEEANQNGENADNGQTVLGSDTDGERAPRSLDEQQTEDVSGTASERNAVEDSGQRESEAERVSDRADAADRAGRSEGDSERGDIQLTEEETQAKAEELAETVEREIEQKSTEQPKGSNFVIGDSLNLPNGEKARFRANVDAIRLIKQLETEDRFATAAEQEILSKYVGWGGLSNAFGDLVFNRETRKTEMVPKDEWKNEFAELKALVDEGIITEQEYKSMSESTKNAHYTSVEVIKAMYDGLASLGFKGGRMLEPSAGVGNFVGAMPADMTAKVNSWTMVEIERITGLISKHLYPNSDVRIQGFENANIPDNYMDVAIGNVPFGNYGVVDKTYPNRITKAIHNYFFAKSIDKVRPGGIVMFVTSSFTMNAKDTAVRQYIMERADLLGAIRLPNTAFKGNAGTDVVTDILILKKRESGTAYAGEDFLEADYDNTYGTYVSNYFKNHPEMVLGKPVTKRGMYGAHTLTFEPFTDRGTIDDQIREAFKNIKGKMDYPTKLSPEKTNFAVEKATKKSKAGGFVVNTDGSISRNENGKLVKYDTDEKTAKRIAGILSIRDAYKTLANYLQQGQDAKYIKQARKALNEAYDKFVKEYGYINTPANKKAIEGDPDQYSIISLENYDAKKKTAKKADIFTKDTISANKTITHVDSVEEGVIASINLTGGVDTALIAKLTDKTVENVTRDIIDARLAFKTRNGTLIARESYLSGNVRAKLREAEALAPYDQDFNHNIEELRKVIPADIPYNEIYITPGATFIPNEIYADFIAHMLGGRNNQNYGSPDVEVGRTTSGEFKIILNNKRLKNNYYNTQTWGTARKSFLDLIDAMMGSRTVRVNDTVETSDGRKVSVLNEAETEAANEKVKAIQQEFEDWIWKDENRRKELARLYNETFNAIVNPKYDGSHLSVNGISTEYSLRPHQANAVHRIISSGGNTLLAHRVGAGKTLEMAAAAMKMRELGVIKKPVFVVPKNVVAQWGVEFHSYFPAARILVADDKSFTPANRKIFTNQIANGDYDAVIVSYEQFEKIPMSAEYQARFYEEQINEIIAAIAEEKAESRDGKGLTVKEMEKKKAQLEKKLKELTSKPKDENNIDFEMLGIDSLFVDEAHNFKNLEYVSKMSNVAGLGSAKGAQRSFDLYTKIRYLQGLNGGRGVVFATATPVMNSMVELYIMQRYLQPDVLNQLGLKSFDAWAKQFGEVVNKWEINPSGTGMRQKQVFANFRNLNELQLLFRSFSDVLTEVPGLKIPKMKGGAVKIIECEPGEFQKNYMQELQKRAENVKNVDPKEDNMLKITSDGRKVSYTQRMIDPTLPYEPESKIFKAAENVLKEYQESADIKGTQIVFLDMATPKGADKSKAETTEDSADDGYDEESARLYDDMRDYLVKKGIPKREIAFIHEANTDAKRKQLFEDVNDGKVRVLMGSTGKMGVGMNAQKRVVAIHHLDAPWRPGDVEQRDGRAFRQKNINEEVSKYVYVTKGSFDSRLWDILDRKQHFINQIMNGEDVGRIAEDTGEVTLSAAEVKALASGNPLIEEQTKLTDAIKKLENLQKAYNSSIVLAKTKLSDDEVTITNHTNRIARINEDIKARVDTYSEGKFSMTVGKQVFTDKKDAGVALAAEIAAKANANSYATVGKFAGFELRVIKNGSEYSGLIHGKEGYRFNVYMNNTTRMVNHIGEVIAGFENMIKYSEQMIDEATADRDAQKNILAQPFEKRDELAQKRARFNEVMELLAPKNEQQHSKMEDDTVQEQSREYLDEQHQQRTDTLTDREVLELAANEVKVSDLTQAEKDALTIFQDRLSNLKDLQEERAEQGRLYKEQQFGEKVDRAKAAETLNRMHILDDQIKKATAEVLTVEEKEVLKRVLTKARKVVEAQEREHGKEILNRWRDRRNNAAAIKKYRDRLRGDVDDLSNWILHPNNKDTVKHVPDVLKNTVIPFLSSINFMSKRALNGGAATKADEAFMSTLKNLQGAIKTNIDTHGLYSGYNDLPSDFMDRLDTFIKSTEALVKNNSGELVINQMTSEELKELSQVVRTLKKYIMQFNSFHYNAMYQHVYEAGENSIQHLTELGDAGNTGAVSTFLLWQQIRPPYAFERFGNGGIAIYDGLRRGQAKLAFNTKEIQAFTEKAYTEKEVKAWEEEIKTFRFGTAIVKMPVSYIMSFYELSKDPEALAHINGEGIRVATYTHKGKKISDTGHILTLGEFTQIIGSLTDRQKQVADSLQKYMATQGAKWGNYVSVARFGEELFTNPKYFPINSDGRHLQANTDEHPSAAALYALLNMSFTKSRKEGANNRIMIYSIFDVFANHMASMAQYNAMALPILDALKWFNYQQVFVDDEGNKQKGESVRERMDRAYGVPEETRPGRGKSGYAQDFVMNIIKAFNGTEAQGTPFDSFGLKPLHRYNVAQVAYNLRVVVQQPLAITRAGMLLDYSSILKGMKLKPSEIKKNIEEMQKYSGIAAWKSLGFYDVNISRGLTHIIKHDSTFMDKVSDIGMWGAEKADLLTWAAIWSACKVEVVKKQLAEKDGFYEAVAKLFEDVIYKTQVVDSILTKNEFMRDKGTFARLIGSFMSEPSTNASMLIDAYDQYALDMQRGMTRQQAWKKNSEMIGRRLYVYAVGAILLAAVQAAADALRDDDDYEEWYEKYLEEFGGNLVDELMPFNKLPILSDFYDLAKELLSIVGVDTYGNPPQSVFMQWYESLVNGTEIIYQKISGEDTNYTWYSGIYKLLQAASGITGLPMASATREIITAWNNIVGAMAPSLKIKTYEPSELSQIRYAYEDGYLTYEEATAQLLEQGLADNENDAYFIMQGWEAGDDYSRYDAIYDAVRNGASIDADMAELTSHGYTEEEVLSQVKTKIGKWYKDGEISKQQATNMLTKYFGMDSSKINATLSYWEYKATNPDTEVYVDWFEKYYSDVSASGMSLNEYLSYKNKVKDITGEDKKARRMAVINSLPITNAQKDALYFAEGWAESKLYEAPWH